MCLSTAFLTSHSQAHAGSHPVLLDSMKCFQVWHSDSPAELPNSWDETQNIDGHTGSLPSATPCDWTELTFCLQEEQLTPTACQEEEEVKSGLPECVGGKVLCWNPLLDRQALSPSTLQGKIWDSRHSPAPHSFTQIQNGSGRTMRLLLHTNV